MRFLLLLCLLSVQLSSFSQADGVSVSETFEGEPEQLILPLSDDFAIFFETNDSRRRKGGKKIDAIDGLNFKRYNKDFKQLGEYNLAWEGNREMRGVHSLGEKLIWLYNKQVSAGNPISLCAQIIEPDGKLGKETIFFSYDSKSELYYDYQFVKSPDGTKNMILIYPKGGGGWYQKEFEPESLTFSVFSSEGEQLSQIKNELNATIDQFAFYSTVVDNEGNGYVINKMKPGGSAKERRKNSSYKIELRSINTLSKEVLIKELKFDDNFISDFKLISSSDGKPALFGLRHAKSNRGRGGIDAYVFSNDVVNSQSIASKLFSPTELERMGKKVTNKKEGSLSLRENFQIRDALAHDEIGYSILLEIYDYHPGDESSEASHNYFDGLILELSNNGDLHEFTVIPKSQKMYGRKRSWASTRLLYFKNSPAVVYNDNPTNFGRDLEERTKKLAWRDGLALLSYSENGKLKRIPMTKSSGTDNMLISPSSMCAIRTGELIFLANRTSFLDEDKYLIGKITGATMPQSPVQEKMEN